jgi:hypothetical protein
MIMSQKFYLIGLGLFISLSGIAQSKTAQITGLSVNETGLALEEVSRGGNVLWSEDFGNGIPSDWAVFTLSGPVEWKHTMVGHTGNYPTAPLASTTGGNGWMIVDSDGDNASGGPNEDSKLITSRIDLTGFANVKLEFQQMFRRWQSDVTTVQISLDSITWTDYVLNSTITQSGTPNPDYVNIDISSIAGNQDSVWISFWWQGAWDYGWQIDDIAITEILDNDITIKNEKFGEFVEYYKVPMNQVQPFLFSSDVENIGMLTQSNITLDITVNDGTTDVYTGTSATLALLTPWTTDSIGLSSGFTPTALGNFTITFDMNQAETDEAPASNTRVKSMQVTDTVYALDNGNYVGQWFNQESGPGSSDPFVIGGAYDIFTNDVASSISVYIGDNTTVGCVFIVKLWEWDGAAWVSVNNWESDLYTVTANDLGNWVTPQLFVGASLAAGGTYLASVEHYGGPEYLWIGYSSNSNPGYTVSSSDGGTTFNGQPRNPMIRLNLGSAVGIEEQTTIAQNIYPNPANESITIQLENNTNSVSLEIIDITGKAVMTKTLNGNMNNHQVDVRDLARGVYTLRLTSANQTQSKQIVLTK